MANLILICRRCTREVEDVAGQMGSDGLCATCYITEVLEPYKVEMTRLWRKYSHYVARGISVANQDHQIQNKFRRGLKKVLDSVPGVDPREVERIVVQVLITDAQGVAAGFERIVRAA